MNGCFKQFCFNLIIMRYIMIRQLLLFLIVGFFPLYAALPAEFPQVLKPKIGTIVKLSPRRALHSHRRVSSIDMGTAFTNTVLEIMHKKSTIEGQQKQKKEQDILAPLKIFAQTVVNSPNQFGSTGLHLAAFTGGERGVLIIKHLLTKGEININARDNEGRTPLLESIRNDQYGTFQLLMNRKEIDVTLKDSNGRSVSDYIEDLPASSAHKIDMRNILLQVIQRNLARTSMAADDKKRLVTYRSKVEGDVLDERYLMGSDDCGSCCWKLSSSKK